MTIWKTILILPLFLLGCTDDKASNDDSANEQDTSNVQDTDSDTEETGPTIWSGDTITFAKEDNADHTAPENQDIFTNFDEI